MLKMMQFGQFLLLLFLLNSSSCFESEIALVILDDTAKIRPTIDNYVMTNVDYQPNDEPSERLDVLQDSLSIPTKSIASERSKKKRQIVNPLLKSDYLFFGNEQYLVNINRDGTGTQGITTGTRNIISVDFDIRDSYMFWSDVVTSRIYRAKMDGTQLTTLVHTDITTPDGIAWDWTKKKLYWSDAAERDIEVLDPSTGIREVIVRTGSQGISIPRAVVLDPFAEKIYWSDWGTQPRIERISYTDKRQRETIHSLNLGWPNALTLDLDTQTLYWADALLDRIECSKSDGTGRRLLINQFINHPFGIDFFDGTLYWTDWSMKAVLNSTIAHDTSQPTFTIYGVISNLNNRPMGLKVVSLSKQPQVSPVLTPASPPCVPPCQNGGSCNAGVCKCSTGWTGPRCKNAVCQSPCQNGGTCASPDSCTCPPGWTGNTCSEAICSDGCMNGGSCALPGVCTCSDGWRGTTCEEPICSRVCEHGSCTGPDVCTCRSGWTGEWCENAICNPECEKGDCVRPDECLCHSGWRKRLCDEPICERTCQNGGDCVAPNTCHCHSPYHGPTCAEVDCFPPNGCLNGGKCVSYSQCSCPSGWDGVRCEIPLCGSTRCVHGVCSTPNECRCNTGWEGKTCQKAICFRPSGCQNGGVCIIPGFCSCATGWTGERCDEGVCANNCNGKGNCIGANKCRCHDGWSGDTCNEAVCNPGCVHGVCILPNICHCDVGYGGFRCEY